MKEAELRAIVKCAACRKPFGHTGLPIFWRVSIERHGVKADAVRRQDHLAGFIGSAAIAAVMGPDEDMTIPLMEPKTVTICEQCVTATVCVAQLAHDD